MYHYVRVEGPLTSSVPAAPVPAAALVAAAGSLAVVIPLEATASAATEPALPVVKAFVRGRAGLAALLIVLLQQSFGLVLLQLSERHPLQEVTSLRESKVGLGRDRGDHRRRIETAHPARDGWRGRQREREKEGEGGCSEDQRTHTTRRQKKKIITTIQGQWKSLRNYVQIDES